MWRSRELSQYTSAEQAASRRTTSVVSSETPFTIASGAHHRHGNKRLSSPFCATYTLQKQKVPTVTRMHLAFYIRRIYIYGLTNLFRPPLNHYYDTMQHTWVQSRIAHMLRVVIVVDVQNHAKRTSIGRVSPKSVSNKRCPSMYSPTSSTSESKKFLNERNVVIQLASIIERLAELQSMFLRSGISLIYRTQMLLCIAPISHFAVNRRSAKHWLCLRSTLFFSNVPFWNIRHQVVSNTVNSNTSLSKRPRSFDSTQPAMMTWFRYLIFALCRRCDVGFDWSLASPRLALTNASC